MKDLPKHLKIGKSVYCVVLSPDVDERYAGSCDQDRKVILLSSEDTREELMATFAHEILHALEVETKVKLGHKRINKMEYALAQVFEQLK